MSHTDNRGKIISDKRGNSKCKGPEVEVLPGTFEEQQEAGEFGVGSAFVTTLSTI